MRHDRIIFSSRVFREARTQSGKLVQALVNRRPTLLYFLESESPMARRTLSEISKKRHAIAAAGAAVVIIYKIADSGAEFLIKQLHLNDLPRVKDPHGSLFHAFRNHPKSFGRQYLERVYAKSSFHAPDFEFDSQEPSDPPSLFMIVDNEITGANTTSPASIDQALMDWIPDRDEVTPREVRTESVVTQSA